MTIFKSIAVPFNNQQTTAIKTLVIAKGIADGIESSVKLALAETSASDRFHPRYSPSPETPPVREVIEEYTLQPGTGKAVVVRDGQVIRLQQIGGGQCIDFNCYNLHDRNELMSAGRTRSIHGVSPATGDLLWTKAPWERPIMAIVSSNSVTDTLIPCCSALLYRLFYRSGHHTNCQQIQEEAQREWGIPSHSVHESFNTFMCVGVDKGGDSYVLRNSSKAGDYIDLYALMDVLAIPNVCGDDLDRTNNFALKPVSIQVLSALDSDRERAAASYGKFEPVIAPNPEHLVATPLSRDPNYLPKFPFLVEDRPTLVSLDTNEMDRLSAIRNSAVYGDDDGAALRDVTMSWLLTRSFH